MKIVTDPQAHREHAPGQPPPLPATASASGLALLDRTVVQKYFDFQELEAEWQSNKDAASNKVTKAKADAESGKRLTLLSGLGIGGVLALIGLINSIFLLVFAGLAAAAIGFALSMGRPEEVKEADIGPKPDARALEVEFDRIVAHDNARLSAIGKDMLAIDKAGNVQQPPYSSEASASPDYIAIKIRGRVGTDGLVRRSPSALVELYLTDQQVLRFEGATDHSTGVIHYEIATEFFYNDVVNVKRIRQPQVFAEVGDLKVTLVRDTLQLELTNGQAPSLGLREVRIDAGSEPTLSNADKSFAAARAFIRDRKKAIVTRHYGG